MSILLIRRKIIDDCDVGCPIPTVPESIFGEYNWFLSSIRIGRIFSVAYSSLFSVSASIRSSESLLSTVSQIQKSLEEWKQSIPLRFRPGETPSRALFGNPAIKEAVFRTHFYYHNLTMAFERLKAHLAVEHEDVQKSNLSRLHAARGVVEMLRFVDIEPYTPLL